MKKKPVDYLLAILAVAAFVYHMAYTQFVIQGTHRHSITHLGFSLLIIFLIAYRQSSSKFWRGVFMTLFSTSLVSCAYLWLFYEDLLLRVWNSTSWDLVVGVALLISCFVICYKYFGPAVPIIAAVFVIYPFVGVHLPEPFYSISYPLARTINNLTTSLGAGLFDIPLRVSSLFLFLVVMLGFVLNGLGATKFFSILARRYQHLIKSGPGLLAVVSSAGVGSIVGSGEANVAITGSFTIPTMLKAGYRPSFAAAIEAVASTGGGIMPPIMGSIAFVMVGYTGIPYLKVIQMAIIPAILYFFLCGMHIHLTAKKEDYKLLEKIESTPEEYKAETKELFQSLFLFLVPFTVLVVLIVSGKSVSYAIFWAIISVFAASIIMKETRPTFETVINCLVEGAENGGSIAIMCAVVGLIIASLNMSGMGVKLTAGIEGWSGGSLLLGLLIIFLISVLMGMAGIATAAYVLVAIFAVPALLKLGVEFEVAHFFAMYPTNFTLITPPVALAVLVASRLAGSDYFKSSIEAVKIAASGFLLPFLFIYAPVLLWRSSSSLEAALLDLIASVGCLLAIQIGNVGYMFARASTADRLFYYLSSVILFAFVVTKSMVFFYLGVPLLLVLLFLNYRKKKINEHIINEEVLVQ